MNKYSYTNRSHCLWLTITTRLFAKPRAISQTSSCRGSSKDVTDVTLKLHRAVHGCCGAGRIKFSIAETRYRWARTRCERITFLIYFDDEGSKYANVFFCLSLKFSWSDSLLISQSLSQTNTQAFCLSVSVYGCLSVRQTINQSVRQSVIQTVSLSVHFVSSVCLSVWLAVS